MPEGLEAEIWRRAIDSLVGRSVNSVWFDDRALDDRTPGIAGAIRGLVGEPIEAVVRRGKVVQLAVGDHLLGLHFGMTGRVIVDGVAPIAALEYSSNRDRPEWDTLRLYTGGADSAAATSAPALRVNDPRRLGRISLDADLAGLGMDIFDVTPARLTDALSGRRAAVKTLLLDQTIIAGLGNLCADEVLWWAGIAPQRPADTLEPGERAALSSAIRRRLPILLRRGGSTHGELDPAMRARHGPCPRDGAALERATIGGRTAVWCPEHQR